MNNPAETVGYLVPCRRRELGIARLEGDPAQSLQWSRTEETGSEPLPSLRDSGIYWNTFPALKRWA